MKTDHTRSKHNRSDCYPSPERNSHKTVHSCHEILLHVIGRSACGVESTNNRTDTGPAYIVELETRLFEHLEHTYMGRASPTPATKSQTKLGSTCLAFLPFIRGCELEIISLGKLCGGSHLKTRDFSGGHARRDCGKAGKQQSCCQ